jgi:hypothetical protein
LARIAAALATTMLDVVSNEVAAVVDVLITNEETVVVTAVILVNNVAKAPFNEKREL